MKSILVTGGAGYVGSVLAPRLLEEGYNVRVIDLMIYDKNSLDSCLENSNFELIKGDIRDNDTLKRIIKDIDCVIHLAAISNDPTAELDENITKSVNYTAVGELVKIVKESGVGRFINFSSSSMYGIQDNIPATETSPTNPLSLYARYKLESEKFVNDASDNNFVTVNVRPATICGYSPRQRFDLAVNTLTYHALVNGKIIVHGGQQRRPNITMRDIARLLLLLINVDASFINGETFNAGFENLRIIDIAKRIQKRLKPTREVGIQIEDVFDSRDFLLNSEKLMRTLHFYPKFTIEDAVDDLVRAFENNFFPDPTDAKYFNIKKMKLGDFK